MNHPLRVLALALLLAATPACAQLGGLRLDNPIAAADTLDQRAYALINTYAAVLEEATDVIRDPRTPVSVKDTLVRAEQVATPAVETLAVAARAYVAAQADLQAASASSQPAVQRAATTLSVAARRLNEAINDARGPIAALQAQLR